MTVKQQNSFLFPLAQWITDIACRIGGIPSAKEWQQQLREKTRQIEQIKEQQQALYRVISKIRASLDLDTIFQTTTKETCKLLRVERMAIYRFSEDWGGEFVHDFEFSQPAWQYIEVLGQNTVWNDTYLQENQGGRYRHNEMLVVSDIYQASLSQCHIEMLEQFRIRAYATAPIFIGQQLWGILAAYQHSQPYQWRSLELTYLSQVATQLGFAVKQAEFLAKAEQKARDLEEANQKQQILYKVITEIRESLDLATLFSITAKEVRRAMKADRVAIFQFAEESHREGGQFIAENTLPLYGTVIDRQLQNHCFADRFLPLYLQGRMQILSDIDQHNLTDCYVDLLKQFQIKAQIVIPILKSQALWGLLCIHQCSAPREWKDSEIEFLRALAAHFNVALEHADLLNYSRQQAAQLEELTRLDPLLKIANRRYLEEVLEKEWQRLKREKAYLSLIILDLDYFGRYNNVYGHPAGDTCLIKVIQAIQSVLKRSTDLLARWGGEEFMIILPHTEQQGAITLAQEIQKAIKELEITHPDKPAGSPFVTASMGIASQIPAETHIPNDLITQADQALFLAKNSGRNCWRIAKVQVA